ncbi:hypothetical protein SprV_0501963600 [Sparganum proliferum]
MRVSSSAHRKVEGDISSGVEHQFSGGAAMIPLEDETDDKQDLQQLIQGPSAVVEITRPPRLQPGGKLSH